MNCWNHSLSFPKQLTYFDISGSDSKGTSAVLEEESEKAEVGGKNCENSTVFSSLPLAIKWLRDSVLQQNRSVRLQVMPFQENEFFFLFLKMIQYFLIDNSYLGQVKVLKLVFVPFVHRP